MFCMAKLKLYIKVINMIGEKFQGITDDMSVKQRRNSKLWIALNVKLGLGITWLHLEWQSRGKYIWTKPFFYISDSLFCDHQSAIR